RHAPFVIAFRAGDFGAAQAARRLDLDSLRAHAHRTLHGALHGATERDPLGQLVCHAVPDELGVELGTLDLLDVDPDLLARELRQLVAQLVDLGAPLPDHHARAPGVDRDGHFPGLALDVHVGDRRVRQSRLQVFADQLVFLEQLGEVVARVIARAPLLDDPQAEPVRMRFLAHLSLLFLLLVLLFRGLAGLLGLGSFGLRFPRRRRPSGPGYGFRLCPGLRLRGPRPYGRGYGCVLARHVDLDVAGTLQDRRGAAHRRLREALERRPP